MRWFRKDRQPEVWEIADDQPSGDIGAAQKIREICTSAGAIAETMAAAATPRKSEPPALGDTRRRSNARSKSP